MVRFRKSTICRSWQIFTNTEISCGRRFPRDFATPRLWLAKELTMNNQCNIVYIELHPEARWSDGTPLTTADVAFTMKLLLHPKLVDPPLSASGTAAAAKILGADAFKAGLTGELEGIRIIDDHRMEIHLAVPDCLWTEGTHTSFIGIQPRHLLEPVWDELDTHPYLDGPVVTSGPYKQTRLELNQYVELERWDDWWGNEIFGQPRIKRLAVVQFTTGTTPRHTQLEAGELHVGGVDGAEVARFERMNHLVLYRQPTLGIQFYFLNHKKPYMTKEVRQAIDYALNKPIVAALAHFGLSEPVATPIFGPDWAVNPDIQPRPYDPAKARQLLEQAGWDFSRKLVYIATDVEDKRGEVAQQLLREVGIDMEIQVMSPEQWRQRLVSGDYDMSASGGGVLGQDPSVICTYFTPDSAWTQWVGWTNERFYELCAAINATRDQAERQRIAYELQEILFDELPWISYGRMVAVFAVDKRLGGFKPNPYSINRGLTSVMDWYWIE
ncbi:MAG TPA: ABC transporter substrate-binding protein [Limnochordales bacterium]|nr:ABC transporter substrate-binding protein [Limnochordales bacterium]